MEDILVAKLIATAAKQIALFLIILGDRERGHCGLHHLHDDARQDQREIAVLKLIGTRKISPLPR
jgi:hypothetical protein